MTSFSGFRDGINFLRRRFSSNDLPGEDEATPEVAVSMPTSEASDVASTPKDVPSSQSDEPPKPPLLPVSSVKSFYTSAPCSPSKPTSLSNSSQNITSSSNSIGKGSEGIFFTRSLFSRTSSRGSSLFGSAPPDPKKIKTLFIIDDSDVNWEKYFAGKKLKNLLEVHIERADFSHFFIVSSSNEGVTIETNQMKNNKQIIKNFKPNFIFLRQKAINEVDKQKIKSFINGGSVGMVDLSTSLLFSDTGLLSAKLQELSLNSSSSSSSSPPVSCSSPSTSSSSSSSASFPLFPFIQQYYFCSSMSLLQTGSSLDFPIVLKTSNHSKGKGMIRIETVSDLDKLINLTQLMDQSAILVQPYIEALMEIIIYKIGNQIKTFMRTPLEGNWIMSGGKMIIEEVKVQERHKKWVEELSNCFQGLPICGLQVLVAKNNEEFIIGAYDSCLQLLGDKQEDDLRLLSNVAIDIMESNLKEKPKENQDGGGCDKGENIKPENQTNKLKSKESEENSKEEDAEDTMKNLRKTFAGIFGDM